jgi:hypothetical protein
MKPSPRTSVMDSCHDGTPLLEYLVDLKNVELIGSVNAKILVDCRGPHHEVLARDVLEHVRIHGLGEAVIEDRFSDHTYLIFNNPAAIVT